MSGRGGRFPCPRGGPAAVRGARCAENGDGGAPGDRFSEGSGLALRAALAPLLEEGGAWPGAAPRCGEAWRGRGAIACVRRGAVPGGGSPGGTAAKGPFLSLRAGVKRLLEISAPPGNGVLIKYRS